MRKDVVDDCDDLSGGNMDAGATKLNVNPDESLVSEFYSWVNV